MEVEEKAFLAEEIENRQLLFGAGRAVGAAGLRDCDYCAVGKCPQGRALSEPPGASIWSAMGPPESKPDIRIHFSSWNLHLKLRPQQERTCKSWQTGQSKEELGLELV